MFGLNKYHNIFKKIDKCAKVAIFGTLEEAVNIKHALEKHRPDVKLVCFFDSFKTGELENTPICSPHDLDVKKHEFDFIIISSFSNQFIIRAILNSFDIKNENILTVKEMAPNKMYYVTARKSEEVLKTKADRKLYRMLTGARYSSEEVTRIKQYAQKRYLKVNFLDKQYFEHINSDAIETVLEGGVCDGFTTVLFMSKFPNLKKLYGFEPLWEKLKNPLYVKGIRSSGKVQIIEKGMWDKKETISFAESADMGSSRIVSSENIQKPTGCKLTTIKTTTIDAFVQENNIKKVDYIKMDIENSEMQALKGGEKTILRDRPQLAICIYHSPEQFVEIPLYLNKLLHNYVFRLGHYTPHTGETVLYAIPKELA